jgi:hypothetical protein
MNLDMLTWRGSALPQEELSHDIHVQFLPVGQAVFDSGTVHLANPERAKDVLAIATAIGIALLLSATLYANFVLK